MLASLSHPAHLPARSLWIRDARFDLAWLIGAPIAGVGLLLLVFPVIAPVAWPIYALTTGQAHFAATYARVYFEPAELKRHWRAAVFLPGYLLAAILLTLALLGEQGVAVLFTLAFAWGYWHYIRQAFGVARQYQRKLDGADAWDRRLLSLAIHVPAAATAVWFLASLDGSLLGLPVLHIPLPREAGIALLLLAPLALVPALVRAALGHGAGAAGRLDLLTTLATGGVFYLALVAIPEKAAAHLAVSMWHTVQYHAFVYNAQVKRFPKADQPGLLPWLLAAGQRWRYFVFLMVLAFAVFAFPPHLTRLFGAAEPVAIMVANIVWLVVNLHHYLLDGWIWVGPKKPAVAATPAAPAAAA